MANGLNTSVSQTKSTSEKIQSSEVLKQQKIIKQKTERQEKRKKADKQAAQKSPKQAEKLATLNTKINLTIDGQKTTLTIETLCRKISSLSKEEQKAILKSIEYKENDNRRNILSKITRYLRKQEKAETKQTDAEKAKAKVDTQAEKAETQAEKLSEQQKSEEDKKTETEKSSASANESSELAKNILEQERREKILSSLVGKSKKYMKAGASEKVAQYARSIQKSPNTPIFKSLVKQGYKKEDIQSGKYNATIQAHIITTKPSEFAPSDPAKLRAYTQSVNKIAKYINRPIYKPTKVDVINMTQSVVLGSSREAVTNLAVDAVESGQYESVQYKNKTDEIVFESKSGNGRYIIDTSIVPPTTRIESGVLSVEKEVQPSSPEDERRSDLNEKVAEMSEKSILQKADMKYMDTSNPQVQTELIRMSKDTKPPFKSVSQRYVEAQNTFLNETGEDGKPKSTEQRHKDAKALQGICSELYENSKKTTANSIIQSIQNGITKQNTDIPLENTLSQQKSDLDEHITTLKALEISEKQLQKEQESIGEKRDNFEQNARDNIAWLTNNKFERVGQGVIDSAIDTLNVHRPSGKQLQLGEVMTNEDKKLLRNTLYNYVLSVENEVEGREEQNKENEGEMTMIEKEKRVREILTTKISNNAGEYERIFAQSVAVGQDVEGSVRKRIESASIEKNTKSGGE